MNIPYVRKMANNQYKVSVHDYTYFQSYNTIVAWKNSNGVFLRDGYWDMYSATTNKYLNEFLNTNGIAEIRDRVKQGEFIVGDLK